MKEVEFTKSGFESLDKEVRYFRRLLGVEDIATAIRAPLKMIRISSARVDTQIAREIIQSQFPERSRRHRRSPQEVATLDSQIKELFLQGATTPEISSIVGVSLFDILNSIQRLRVKGQVSRRMRSQEEIKAIDTKIKPLIGQLYPRDIAKVVEEDPTVVRDALHRIRVQEGTAKKRPKS